jgi:hypothetical protein
MADKVKVAFNTTIQPIRYPVAPRAVPKREATQVRRLPLQRRHRPWAKCSQ